MDSEGVLISFIHEHLLMPWNDLTRGRCCGRFEATSDGYYCKRCDFFFHKKCVDESSEYMEHPSHPNDTLLLRKEPCEYDYCNFCGKTTKYLYYSCKSFSMDLYCLKHPPPKVIEISKTHHHKLTLLKNRAKFDCDAKCGKITGYEFPYKCHECDLAFHVDCVWHPSELKHPLEVNHSYHPSHPLKLHTGPPPDYSDRKCRLCTRKIGVELFYHCSACNFTLDMRCVLNPPLQSLLNLKAHDHQLTLLPRLHSFTCNACGLTGDRSPYICVQCDFMIHQGCLDLPRLININRHDHRISRTSVLGVVNSVCGVCRQKVDWTCGGFTCHRCPGYVVHSRCATRNDVWNGKELEGVPEETEDIKPFVVIDDNTIQHFSHKEHYLRLHVNGVICDDNKRCRACTHPICLESFYSCMDCDFIFHQNCAGFPRMKRHVLHNERLTLVTNEPDFFTCHACGRWSNGFRYYNWLKTLDVQCGSISEPFFHPSHFGSALYYTAANEELCCNGCKKKSYHVLRCIELNCRFAICFNCATIPQVVKHRTEDHALSLCYGEKASGKYWCDICEKETNPETWFYTCKDQQASLHTECVLGDFSGLMPRSTIKYEGKYYEVVLNNGITRPFCRWCNLHCVFPIILRKHGTYGKYYCSFFCMSFPIYLKQDS